MLHIMYNMNLLSVGWRPSGWGLCSVSSQQAAKAEPRPQAQHPAGLWNQIFIVHKASAKYEESALPNKTHLSSRARGKMREKVGQRECVRWVR